MTKILLTGFLFLFSVLATAETKSEWVSIYESKEETDTEVGFEIIQKKFPSIFGKFSPKSVYRANITVNLLQFNGQHSCSPNDLRLLVESSSYGACIKNSNKKGGSCFQTASRMPTLKDPCAVL